MNREELKNMLAAGGLVHRIGELEPLITDTIRISTHLPTDEEFPIGRSRFGGHPDLPESVDWPTAHDVLLEFVGQINLEDLSGLPAAALLPPKGMLSFFYDGMLTTYDKSKVVELHKVLYTPDGISLQRKPLPPAGEDYRFETYRSTHLEFTADMSLPSTTELANDIFPPVWSNELTSNELWKLYDPIRESLVQYGHHLFGHQDEVQDGFFHLECVKAYDRQGLYTFVEADFKFTNQELLVQELPTWRQLLQVGSDPNTQMSWGDAGIVYFWMKDEDLQHLRFDRSHCIMQCG